QDLERHRRHQRGPAALYGNREQGRVRAIPARSFGQRLVSVGVSSERTPGNLHRLCMLRIVRTQLDSTVALLDDMELIAFLEPKARKEFPRQDETNRIPNFFDLENKALGLIRANGFSHEGLTF